MGRSNWQRQQDLILPEDIDLGIAADVSVRLLVAGRTIVDISRSDLSGINDRQVQKQGRTNDAWRFSFAQLGLQSTVARFDLAGDDELGRAGGLEVDPGRKLAGIGSCHVQYAFMTVSVELAEPQNFRLRPTVVSSSFCRVV